MKTIKTHYSPARSEYLIIFSLLILWEFLHEFKQVDFYWGLSDSRCPSVDSKLQSLFLDMSVMVHVSFYPVFILFYDWKLFAYHVINCFISPTTHLILFSCVLLICVLI